MSTIPVGRTIREAYSFTFGQLGTIIGLIWIPMVLTAVLTFLPTVMSDANIPLDQDPTAAGAAALRDFIFLAARLLLGASMYVAVTRQALGLRKGGAVAHLVFGRAEFRLLGAILLLSLILFFFLAAYAIAIAALNGLAGGGKNTAMAAMMVVIVLAGAAGLLYIFVRLAFVLVPVVVAEGKINFERAWVLTKGNFWSALLVLLATMVPVFLFLFASYFAVLASDLNALLAQQPSPEQFEQGLNAVLPRHLPVLLGVDLIIAPFSLGLSLGASSAAYRALTGAAGDAPIVSNGSNVIPPP